MSEMDPSAEAKSLYQNLQVAVVGAATSLVIDAMDLAINRKNQKLGMAIAASAMVTGLAAACYCETEIRRIEDPHAWSKDKINPPRLFKRFLATEESLESDLSS